MPAPVGQALGTTPLQSNHGTFHVGNRPSSTSFVSCKRQRREVARAENKHVSSRREERLWQSELAPRQPLARAPDSLKVASVLKSGDFDLESLDEQIAEHVKAGPQNAISRKWKELPSRWKVVAATSMAFVICNMVSVSSLGS